ncbi:hypothetical protein D3C81_2177190 [compost metagenome]
MRAVQAAVSVIVVGIIIAIDIIAEVAYKAPQRASVTEVVMIAWHRLVHEQRPSGIVVDHP